MPPDHNPHTCTYTTDPHSQTSAVHPPLSLLTPLSRSSPPLITHNVLGVDICSRGHQRLDHLEMSIDTGQDEGRASILCTGGRGEGEGGMRGGAHLLAHVSRTCLMHMMRMEGREGEGGAVWGSEGKRGGECGLTHQGILGDSQSPKIKINGGNGLKGEP